MANIMTSCRVVTRAPKLASRSYSHAVLLVARGADGRLARAPAVELRLDIGLDEGQAWRAVLDDTGDGLAVGLAGAVTMEVSGLLSCAPSSLVEGEDSRRHAKVFAKCRHGVFIYSACPLGELIDGRERCWRGRNVAISQRYFSLAVTNRGGARYDSTFPHWQPWSCIR